MKTLITILVISMLSAFSVDFFIKKDIERRLDIKNESYKAEIVEKYKNVLKIFEAKVGPLNDSEKQVVAILLDEKLLPQENPESIKTEMLKDVLNDIRSGSSRGAAYSVEMFSRNSSEYTVEKYINEFEVDSWFRDFWQIFLGSLILTLLFQAVFNFFKCRKASPDKPL